MGVLNVTPDSFSDGGQWLDADRAIRHGLDMAGAGRRPRRRRRRVHPAGCHPDQHARPSSTRVLPVVAALSAQGVVVSIDTMRADVARAAVAAGAAVVNDVSGGLSDPAHAHRGRRARRALRRDALARLRRPHARARGLRRRRRRRPRRAGGAGRRRRRRGRRPGRDRRRPGHRLRQGRRPQLGAAARPRRAARARSPGARRGVAQAVPRRAARRRRRAATDGRARPRDRRRERARRGRGRLVRAGARRARQPRRRRGRGGLGPRPRAEGPRSEGART